MVFKEKLKSTLVGILIACIIIVGFAVAKVAVEGRYAVEATEFDAVLVLGEDLSLDGLELVDNLTLGLFSFPVDESMVLRSDPIDTTGSKELVIARGGKEYVVHFDVKCKVEFVLGDTVIDTQLVVDASEIVLPDAPASKTGYEFSHWDIDTTAELSGNVVVEAVFNEIKYPSLSGLTATYGDTLADIELGSNSYGYWEFVDSLDTSVGEAGNREYSVRFVYYDDPTVYKYDYATVKVEKAPYVFGTINETFYYDGEVKTPSIDGIDFIYAGGANVLPGVYSYSIEVLDPNYSGIYEGTYEILKPTVTVTVSSEIIVYPASVPTFTFEVEGFLNVDLLGIKIDAPEFATQIGEYEIGITYTNENVNYIVHKGTLTVVKGDMPVEVPEISEVTFEDKLSDIEFLGKYLGTWAWESPETVVDDINGIVAYAIFTHDDPNFNPVRVAVEIKNVQKKQLTINILRNVFTYAEGTSYSIVYEITGSIYPDVYSTIVVNGNDPESAVGSHRRALVIESEKYIGLVSTELVINKATPVTDFSSEIVTVWTDGLHLNDIVLPEGYTWLSPTYVAGAGEYSFSAIYTPTDTENYESVTGQLTVKVNKAPVSVGGVLNEYVKTYDKAKLEVKNSGIQAFFTDGTLTVKYYKDGVEVDEMINVGEYTVVVTVSEGTNYFGTVIERSATISPATNTQTVIDNQSVKCLDPMSALTLPEDMEGTWSWLETEIGSAGTKTFTAIYTPDANGNYYPREVEITVTVSKITVDVPTIADKLYTGDEISTGLTDTDKYTVSGDITAINAGTYYVTFTLTDPDNYEWKGDTASASVIRSYKISNALNSWKSEPQNITEVYSGNPVHILAEAEHGEVSVVYTLNGVVVDAPVGVGVYKVTITATADNYDDMIAERTIEITHKIVPLPTVGASFPYNGKEQGITVTDSNLGVLYVVDSETRGTNAESVLSLTLKLKDTANCKWETTDAATVTFTAKITKITVSFTGATTVNKSSWTYTDAEGTATVAPIDSLAASLGVEAQLLYSYNGGAFVTYDQLAKTAGKLNAGAYTVKSVVPASSNWDSVETEAVAFTVNKATPNSINVNWGNSPKTDGLYYQNLLTLSSLQISYNSVNVTVSYTYGISSEGFLAADTKYTFNVTPTDLVNFNSTSFDVTVPLKTVATIGHGGTGYGSIEDALNVAKDGDVVWVVPDTTGNIIILEDVVVIKGVTLRLPYGSGAQDWNSNLKATENHSTQDGTYDHPAESNPSAYLKLRVILAAGKKLTIESGATLDIAGKFYAGGGFAINYCGHTAADYAILELGANSTLDIKGTANVYGYIREQDYNDSNGSGIHLYSGSLLYQPYVLRDFRSGNYLNVVSTSKNGAPEGIYTPFARFVFMNVSPTTTIDPGASVRGNSNIHSTLGTSNFVGLVIGSESEAFIQLTAGYMEFRFDVDEDVMYMHFYGGANLDNFSIDTGIAGSFDSKDFPFVFSCHMNIILDKLPGQSEAIYNIGKENYQFKMMPGSKLTIEQGATVYIDKLNIYTGDFVDDIHVVDDNNNLTTYVRPYPAGQGDAILTVRGKLVARYIGGKVHTDTDGAKIIVTHGTTVSNRELNRFTASFFSSVAVKYTDIAHSLELCYNGTVVKSRLMLNVEYTSSAADANWNFEIPQTVDVELKNGYGVYAEFVLFTDEFGNMYIDSYDSRSTKQNTALIKVVKGSEIIFYLTKNQLLLMNASASANVDMSNPLLTSTGNYEQTFTLNSNVAPVAYYVPSVTLGGGATGTVSYTGLSESNAAGNSTVVVTIVAKTENTIYQNGTLSITVSGIDPSTITFSQTGTPAGVNSGTGNYTITGTDKKNGHSVSITATIVITSEVDGMITITSDYSQGTKECVTPDTLITLADGTQVRVDSLTGGEMLLVWNLETGKFDFAPVMFVDSEEEREYKVIYLYFSDGTLVKVIGEHGFWDYDLNRYVYLDSDAYDYVGHTFAKQNGDTLSQVQLVNVEIKTERTTAWSPVTVGHLCYFVNGMLSMPGGIMGLFNIFEVDAETMTYDLEAMERDIAEFGLFTYEELNAICPLSEDMFYAAGGAYLKISIGKGNLTIEELIEMIERYSKFI